MALTSAQERLYFCIAEQGGYKFSGLLNHPNPIEALSTALTLVNSVLFPQNAFTFCEVCLKRILGITETCFSGKLLSHRDPKYLYARKLDAKEEGNRSHMLALWAGFTVLRLTVGLVSDYFHKQN